MYDSVKDSGVREEFSTGSRRDSREGKGRYDLIPPLFMERIALHYENGAKKYGDNNWQKGMPIRRYYDSAMRHMIKWFIGHKDEDHLSAAIWNLIAIMVTEDRISRGELNQELDDR